MKVKKESEVAQSCPTLSDLMDRSLPGSSIHGIFQARVLEWGAIAFSKLFGLPGLIVNFQVRPMLLAHGLHFEKKVNTSELLQALNEVRTQAKKEARKEPWAPNIKKHQT